MSEKDKNLYGKDSIESLNPREFTRLRPQVYAGDCTYSTQLLVEIISNAVDEYNIGHGRDIFVTIDEDICEVRDCGQGFIPGLIREDGISVLEAAFSVLNTSGKFKNDGAYEGTSLGSFGIGAKITNFLSHWFEVETYRDGKSEKLYFVEGLRQGDMVLSETKERNGTKVRWQPSEEFFTHTEVDIKVIKDLFKTISCLCPGLSIFLTYNGEAIQYYSKNGLNDLLNDKVKNNEIIKNRFNANIVSGKNRLNLVLTYTNSYTSSIIPYVNVGFTEAGPHITQIKTLITRELNKFFREKKWLKEKDENLSGDDCQEGMNVIFNITASNVGYDAQVKSRITKIDIKDLLTQFSIDFQKWLALNEKDIKQIADKALNARKAREAARKAKEAVRNKGEKKPKLLTLPTKLVDAWSKDRSKCELAITEGDSAAAGLIEARDSETQGVFPIRGKILSVMKATDERIWSNQEIVNLVKALGLDVDAKTRRLIYDKTKLRYDRILMCCDGDADGEQIRNLLLTLFWVLCPELIINGHVYATYPPLFRITTAKNEYIFLKDAAALNEYKNAHQGEKYLVSRNKGLGESDGDELRYCILDPATRNIEQMQVNDIEDTDKLFDILMGPSVPPRREYILIHGEEARV